MILRSIFSTVATTATLAALALSPAAQAQNPAPTVTPAAPATTAAPAPSAAPAPAAVPMIEKPAPMAAPPMITEKTSAPPSAAEESGLAAVYSDKLHGRKTASGKRYDRNGLTAAHKTLPFGTKVRVVNHKNKRSVVLTITDRGPVQADRILDITPRAAKALGIHPRGMGSVTMTVMRRR